MSTWKSPKPRLSEGRPPFPLLQPPTAYLRLSLLFLFHLAALYPVSFPSSKSVRKSLICGFLPLQFLPYSPPFYSFSELPFFKLQYLNFITRNKRSKLCLLCPLNQKPGDVSTVRPGQLMEKSASGILFPTFCSKGCKSSMFYCRGSESFTVL